MGFTYGFVVVSEKFFFLKIKKRYTCTYSAFWFVILVEINRFVFAHHFFYHNNPNQPKLSCSYLILSRFHVLLAIVAVFLVKRPISCRESWQTGQSKLSVTKFPHESGIFFEDMRRHGDHANDQLKMEYSRILWIGKLKGRIKIFQNLCQKYWSSMFDNFENGSLLWRHSVIFQKLIRRLCRKGRQNIPKPQ